MSDDENAVGIGRPPVTRRQIAMKLLWICVWLAFLSAPVSDLLGGDHGPWATAFGCLGLATFVVVYLQLFFRHTARSPALTRAAWTIAVLIAFAAALSLMLGPAWLGLFVYVNVSAGAALSLRAAWRLIPAVAVLMACIGLADGADSAGELVLDLLVPALLGGFAMTGVRQLIRTTVELREARATVAQLAANEERLRLARDLHDLLGHSLSLITLKSELAGRMLPGHPEQAALQVADIEQVSRQALADVRDAVTGYRRPTLPGELAGARTALAAAGIAADVPTDAPDADGLPAAREEALAWGLREAVTNVVRHSGAKTCAVTLTPRQTLAGRFLELAVVDDGRGGADVPSGIPSGITSGITSGIASGAETGVKGGVKPGNGLTGLRERLAAVDGTLTTGPAGSGRGFRLTLSVPLGEHALGSPE